MDLISINPWFLLLYCLYLCIQCAIQIFNARSVGKKISSLCSTCITPVIDGEKHECMLNEEELQTLTKFISLLQSHEVKNG
ncbi:hypothetical protein [Microvirus mar34]|uniref:Uncharacterized protein n=1 Tax=Microvirus mar34 TaxID=2851168 RepID=A0A8F5MJ73_9VIRU|nr:hypothetical protein [Microvirus mar34]